MAFSCFFGACTKTRFIDRLAYEIIWSALTLPSSLLVSLTLVTPPSTASDGRPITLNSMELTVTVDVGATSNRARWRDWADRRKGDFSAPQAGVALAVTNLRL